MSSKEKEVEDHSLCAVVSVNEGLPFAVPSEARNLKWLFQCIQFEFFTLFIGILLFA
jgi:hypothetical protein